MFVLIRIAPSIGKKFPVGEIPGMAFPRYYGRGIGINEAVLA